MHRDNNSIRSAHPPRSSLSHDVSSVGESRRDTIKGDGGNRDDVVYITGSLDSTGDRPLRSGDETAPGLSGLTAVVT